MIPANKKTFSTSRSLDAFVSECDVIVHLAGMNRGEDNEIERVNTCLARDLVEAMERVSVRPHVLFSSSTHIERDTAYGRSKRAASAIIGEWANRNGASFCNLILPHVFGEHGRPFYNSVVSTFCHQLATDEQPNIDNDGELELLHAQQVAEKILDAIEQGSSGDLRLSGHPILVSKMLKRVSKMADSYQGGVIPVLDDPLDLRLFNTYRSYLFPDHYPVELRLHKDQRGSLFEAVKSDHGGQAFLSTTRPGVARGNHFHFNKVERFLVVQGEAVIRLRRLFDERVVEFSVRGTEPCYVDMPTLHTHNITNTGDTELLTLFWSHEIFDPAQPDTYPEAV